MTRRPRYNPVTDRNHGIVPAFVDTWRGEYGGYKIDCMDISKTGGRSVDWIIAVGNINAFVEVKTPEAYARDGHGLTAGEAEFFRTWPGRKCIIDCIERLEDFVIGCVNELDALEENYNDYP